MSEAPPGRRRRRSGRRHLRRAGRRSSTGRPVAAEEDLVVAVPGGGPEAEVLEKRDRLEYVGVVVDDVACPQQADPGIALGDGHGGTVERGQGACKF